jgi:hypothetical protein
VATPSDKAVKIAVVTSIGAALYLLLRRAMADGPIGPGPRQG